MDEIALYLKEIAAQEAERLVAQVMATNAGAWGTQDSINALVKDLLGKARNG